ncbi:PREDICTED: 3-oxoacyl-[acyl-carrier-protein] synthase, mitochondrial [Papilio xuthus]|uniref:3-oxoacyl-[acyl-carrier-protein] synthase n=2 Tax=Papilio xuthus TaxID=66420 RepID=A0AAJ7EKA2_PAPXU|nr:PREDICTED: 3-oxoacyl-[acyl-carrier-protein] synthase, mitochondrial [Papilio xuthus]
MSNIIYSRINTMKLVQQVRYLTKYQSQRRVVVSGLGVVSPIGTGTKIVWDNLLKGHCGIVCLQEEDYKKLPCRIAGLISKQDDDVQKALSKANLKSMAPATCLALVATAEALVDAKWFPECDREKEMTGVALGMGMIDLKDVCDTNEALKIGYNKVSPFFVPRILPNMAAGQISIKYGFRGPNHSVSTACATGAHSIGDAYRFIKYGDADVMVCGGAESCISPLAIAGFCRLRALSTSFNDEPEKASRPFDQKRDGFVMGEGAAVLVLEEYEHALRRNAKIYAEILGYGLSGDGSHITAPREDGSGAMLSMGRALQDANIRKNEITYVNAHATSTPIGDGIESTAIKKLFGGHSSKISVSSTKGAHGHLLGAAGNLEAVFTILACQHGVIPPTLNLENPVDDLNYVANVPEKWQTERRVALKNSFGFGGTNATLCIAQI